MRAITTPPSGGQCRVLRRMLTADIQTVTEDGKTVLCTLGGHELNKGMVAALEQRGLVEEVSLSDRASSYRLTAEGKRWAKERK